MPPVHVPKALPGSGQSRLLEPLAVIDRRNRRVQSAAQQPESSGHFRANTGGRSMLGIGDLFQWERFVTPTVIKVFYWLAVVISLLLGAVATVTSLDTMALNPFVGMIFLIASLLGTFMCIIISRIIAESVLIVFRINEHLGAIRNQTADYRDHQ
jgi:hypothetical protein